MSYMKGMFVLAAVMGIAAQSMAEDGFAQEPTNEKDHGIRVSFGVAPGFSEGELLGSTGSLDEDTGGQLEVLYMRRHWTKNNPNFAGIWGAGLFVSSASGVDNDAPPAEFDLSAFGVIGQGGVAYRIGDIVVLEAMPYFGIGAGSMSITGFTDGGATYAMFGVKGGAFVALGKSIELGVEVGYQGISSEVELEDISGYTADLSLTGNGLHASAVLAVKF